MCSSRTESAATKLRGSSCIVRMFGRDADFQCRLRSGRCARRAAWTCFQWSVERNVGDAVKVIVALLEVMNTRAN